MDAAQALADLTEISSQIEVAVLLDGKGALLASTLDDDERARRIGETALRLYADAREADTGHDGGSLAQLEAATPEGSVFVVREDAATVVATTAPEPTVGLVFYDLKSCLRSLDPPARKPRSRRKAEEPANGAA